MWTTLDEEEKEYLTIVHQSECVQQKFSNRKKQFVCQKDGKLCSENCPFYSLEYIKLQDYDEIPEKGIEVDIMFWGGRLKKNGDIIDEDPYYEYDDPLLAYLEHEIW